MHNSLLLVKEVWLPAIPKITRAHAMFMKCWMIFHEMLDDFLFLYFLHSKREFLRSSACSLDFGNLPSMVTVSPWKLFFVDTNLNDRFSDTRLHFDGYFLKTYIPSYNIHYQVHPSYSIRPSTSLLKHTIKYTSLTTYYNYIIPFYNTLRSTPYI